MEETIEELKEKIYKNIDIFPTEVAKNLGISRTTVYKYI